MAEVFDYIFNIGGDYTATINGMSTATGEFTAKVDGAQNSIAKFTTVLAGIDLAKNALDGLKQATDAFSVSGIALDSQMHDLSAIAGVTGDALGEIEGYARDSAKAFGTDGLAGFVFSRSQLKKQRLPQQPETASLVW